MRGRHDGISPSMHVRVHRAHPAHQSLVCPPPPPTPHPLLLLRRDAEQRARAAKLYDRQRQRFQRALLAAEDLEGADSSVFTAVSRKGSATGAGAAQDGGSDAGGGASEADGAGSSNPFLRELPVSAAAAAAAALATADAEEDEEAADVFDPASWDDDVRRQWESFVSSSKVRGGCGAAALDVELAGAGHLHRAQSCGLSRCWLQRMLQPAAGRWPCP